MLLKSLLAVVAGYLLGSFPSAYIAGRLVKKQDVRRIGGGNMGALNILREVGFVPGLLVFIADAGKGALAVLVAKWLGVYEIAVLAAAFASIIGHSWPVFLGFKGGRGGATGYGIFLALAPLAALCAFGVILIIEILTSNARLSLTGGFIAQPFLIWAFGGSLGLIIFSILVPLFLGGRMLIADRHKLADPQVRKNLIVDRSYTWWQSRRTGASHNKNK